MSDTAFVAAASAVGALEAAAWGIHAPPYTAHSPMKPAVRGLLMGVNSVPHLAAAALIARGGGRVDALSWYLPYATFFCAAQAANWWWPYLVGARGRGTDKLFA